LLYGYAVKLLLTKLFIMGEIYKSLNLQLVIYLFIMPVVLLGQSSNSYYQEKTITEILNPKTKTELLIENETPSWRVETTKIRNQDCGKRLSTTKDVVYADIVEDATNYQFKVVNADLGFSFETSSKYTARWIRLMDIPGIHINTTYDIQVRARIGNRIGKFGTICQVITPNTSVPPTQITTGQCGFTFNSMTDVMYADAVIGASDYIFEVTNTNLGYSLTKTGWNGGRGIRLSQFQGLQLNTNYNVRAKAIVEGNIGNYGETCQITTPATARLGNSNLIEDMVDQKIDSYIEMKIYPNPSQGDLVYLELQGLSSNSEIVVSDIFGKTVIKQLLNSDYINYNGTLRFDKKLGVGFYLVTVVSGNQKTTKKLIVQ
jgi:hypothetical protein